MFKAQNESILVDAYYQNRAFILKEGTIAVTKDLTGCYPTMHFVVYGYPLHNI